MREITIEQYYLNQWVPVGWRVQVPGLNEISKNLKHTQRFAGDFGEAQTDQ
ncbi:hypothetical protein [Geothermobacter hydrogeniphilus]|uniref:hypothetical protein n=1 Tax=Geothermobacter hydrogeniphilus TaxID=1969733 RepID=UPI001304EA56|nr:hypothetical protein [Geothermobacter hydrogeniphilus]